MSPPPAVDLPPLLAELHRAIREDIAHDRLIAASGMPGCRKARDRVQRMTEDLLRLETGVPL